MNVVELRDVLVDLASTFFKNAPVLWEEQENTRNSPPYVTLKLGNIKRNVHYLRDDEDDRFFLCSSYLRVNLYTNGADIQTPEGKYLGNAVNTATSDLLEFTKYMESESTTDLLNGKGASLILDGDVQDLTALENDRKYRYRAMAQFSVSFTTTTGGEYGTGYDGSMQTHSGADDSLGTVPIPTIEEVTLKEAENEK